MSKLRRALALVLCCILATVSLSIACSAQETSLETDVIEPVTPSLSTLIALSDRITYTVELEADDQVTYSVEYGHSNPAVSAVMQEALTDYQSGEITLEGVEERLAEAVRILAIADAEQAAARAYPERQLVKVYTYECIADNINLYTAEVTLTATYSTYDNYAQIESIVTTEETGLFKSTTAATPVIAGNVGGITFYCANIYADGAFMGATYQVSSSGTVTHQFATMFD